MRFIFILIASFSVVYQTHAITWTSNRKVAQSTDSAVVVLQKIVSCIQQEKTSQQIKQCSKTYLSETLNDDESTRLLAWLSMPMSLSYPTNCPAEKTENLRDEFKTANSRLLCSDYKLLDRNKTAIFFMSLENGSFKLRNLRK